MLLHIYFLPLSNLSILLFFVVVEHFELREKSTSQFGFSSSIYAVCDDCGMSEFLATGQHNASDNTPEQCKGKMSTVEWFMLPLKWELAEKIFQNVVKF